MSRFAAAISVVLVLAACSGGDSDEGTPQPGQSGTLAPTSTASAGPMGSSLPDSRVTFYGADAGDQAAAMVSGDFNGDGNADVVLGAAFADGPDNERTDAGEAYVYLGPFAQGQSFDAREGAYQAVLYGAAAGDQFARAIAAGDFNGDGKDDIAVGAPQALLLSGEIYVIFGSGDWPRQTDFAETDPDVLLTGADAGDYAGLMLATGDLYESGANDLVVGALLADGPANSREDAGEVYVLLGAELTAGATIALGETPRVVYGATGGSRLGEALTAGNLDGDPEDELVLVAPFASGDNGNEEAGQSYVLDSAPETALDLAASPPLQVIRGHDAGDQLGHSAGIGDTDGDGLGDIWLGAVSADGPENAADLAGEAELVTGAGTRRIVYGPAKEARLGRSLAVGDIDGDELADLLISAPNLSGRAGQVLMYSGGSNLEDPSATYLGLDAGDILGHEAFGTPSLGITDVDGNGQNDWLAAAPGGDGPANDRTDAGEAYVVLVSPGG